MINVLIVLTDTNIGGAGTYVATYLKNCNKDKILPTLLLPENSQVVNLLKDIDCEIIEADIAPDKSLDFGSVSVIRKMIRKGKYDLVHAHGSASARIAAKGLCKCVFTKHTLSQSGSFISKLIYGALGGYAIAVSNTSADNLKTLGFNKKRIFTVYNGVDNMSVPSQREKDVAKASFGISPEKIVIGCVARLHPIKDHKTILKAAKIVLTQNDNAVFLFAGDGELKAELESFAKELGIYNQCIFAGVIYDRQRVYHATDIYTIASFEETFGLSLVESWSSGIASVISEASGLVEVVGDSKASIICKTGAHEQFAKAYSDLLRNESKRKELGLAALMRYKNKFSAKVFAENVENVYIEICK